MKRDNIPVTEQTAGEASPGSLGDPNHQDSPLGATPEIADSRADRLRYPSRAIAWRLGREIPAVVEKQVQLN